MITSKITVIGFICLIPITSICQEVTITRDSQYEWTCETYQGDIISGHTRQDKAFQSCINASFSSSERTIVRGGTFRIETTAPTTPSPGAGPDPVPPDPNPTPPDPQPEPQVTFGPVTSITEYPSLIGALKQDTFRWEITFTLNSLPTTGRMGLASRDQSGTLQPGHLSVWIEGEELVLRHQDACPNCGGSGEVFSLRAGPISAGIEYVAVVSMSSQGTTLWLDGEMKASDPRSWGLAGNDLPLIVGGLCRACTADGTVGPRDPIDGTVYMEIWDDALPIPTVGLELRWINPTNREDGVPLEPNELTSINLYDDTTDRFKIVGVDPDITSYEVVGLSGQERCFVATAVSNSGESKDSNRVCKTL